MKIILRLYTPDRALTGSSPLLCKPQDDYLTRPDEFTNIVFNKSIFSQVYLLILWALRK